MKFPVRGTIAATPAKLGFFSLPVCTLKHHPYLRVTVVRSGPHLDA